MKKTNGYTLIEFILYIALIAIFMSGAILFSWDAIYSQRKSEAQRNVTQNIRLVAKKIAHEVRNANDFYTISVNTLSLQNSDATYNPTRFVLIGDVIYYGRGPSGACSAPNPCPLTGEEVSVTNLNFEDKSDVTQKSKNLLYSISLKNKTDSANYDYLETYSAAAEIRAN